MSHLSAGGGSRTSTRAFRADQGPRPPEIVFHGRPGRLPEGAAHPAGGPLGPVAGAPADTLPGYTSLVLATWQDPESRSWELIEASVSEATAPPASRAVLLAEYASAVLYNGLGHYQAALTAARRTCEYGNSSVLPWALTELVEAGVRSGRRDVATTALQRLDRLTAANGSDWLLGVRARSRALLSDGPQADPLYREALDRLGRSRIALHLARARLVYGEWLRRQRRRVAAREQLYAAQETFSRIGASGFAERSRRELLATGERARRRVVDTRDDLTAQETEIAYLAAAGETNVEIGGRLFISPRTVEWHLRKVFTKLGVSSRKQLRAALPRVGANT